MDMCVSRSKVWMLEETGRRNFFLTTIIAELNCFASRNNSTASDLVPTQVLHYCNATIDSGTKAWEGGRTWIDSTPSIGSDQIPWSYLYPQIMHLSQLARLHLTPCYWNRKTEKQTTMCRYHVVL
jgi:hypothetical protein